MSEELPEPVYRQMLEIVRAVAASEPFQGEGYRECAFCDLPGNETHTPECIVTKARALVEREVMPCP